MNSKYSYYHAKWTGLKIGRKEKEKKLQWIEEETEKLDGPSLCVGGEQWQQSYTLPCRSSTMDLIPSIKPEQSYVWHSSQMNRKGKVFFYFSFVSLIDFIVRSGAEEERRKNVWNVFGSIAPQLKLLWIALSLGISLLLMSTNQFNHQSFPHVIMANGFQFTGDFSFGFN